MTLASCRNCKNFEERRDIDGVVLCARNFGPYVCCDEFKPKNENLCESRQYNRFCLECTNLDKYDIPLCAKNHKLQIACENFIDRFEYFKSTTQNNRTLTALIVYATCYSSHKSLPEWMSKIGQIIDW